MLFATVVFMRSNSQNAFRNTFGNLDDYITSFLVFIADGQY